MNAATIQAARLYGPKDVRTEPIGAPPAPGAGEVTIRVGSVGICGSDLHVYLDGRIGDTIVQSPYIMGHEFGGAVEAVGEHAIDANGMPLQPGRRVAVDPTVPCGHCELCQIGHPNLCPNHDFLGLYPHPGALCQKMTVPAKVCFPVPDAIDDDQVPMLETLGVAIHTIDLAHVRVGHSMLIVGAGPIGLCIAQVAQLAGARPIYIADRLSWRLDRAAKWGATPINIDKQDAATQIDRATVGRGVDIAIESAWCDEQSLAQAVDALRPGGRLVVVGIAGDDRMVITHSTARRKGLTIAMCRRMKHTYPRAIALAADRRIDLAGLITHRFALHHTAQALATAAAYKDRVVKAIVHPNAG